MANGGVDEWADHLLSPERDDDKQKLNDLLDAERFDLILTFAVGGYDVIYPNIPHTNHNLFAELARDINYAKLRPHPTVECSSTSAAEQKSKSEQLATAYYQSHRTPMFTLRLGCCALPKHADIAMVWRQNIHKTLQFLMLTETGVVGAVHDAVTGIPVRAATIDVLLVSGGNGLQQYTVTKNLALFKLILPVGAYRLQFAAKGYESVVRQVSVVSKQRLDVGIVTLLRKGDEMQAAAIEQQMSAADLSTNETITGTWKLLQI